MFRYLTIKSRLLIMLLAVALFSTLVIGYIGYGSGKSAITRNVFNQLTSLRASKAYQIESYFNQVRDQVETLSEDRMMVIALKSFESAFRALGDDAATVRPAMEQALEKYYQEEFTPRLAKNIENPPLARTYLPRTAASRYLQYHFISNNLNEVGSKHLLTDPKDGSDYTGVHVRFHPIFRNLVQKFGYYDMFLISASGEIVYSTYKETDFATNLISGPYDRSSLATAMAAAMRAQDGSHVALIDFQPYWPSYASPAAFVASPIFDGLDRVGVLAFQLPIDEVNRVMTGGDNWERDGLGKSGETYLVGEDHLMRSVSRFLIENPQSYFDDLRSAGVSKDRVERIQRLNTSVMQQEVRSEAVSDALADNAGMRAVDDYRGIPVLSSYQPLDIEGVNWVLLAQMDLDEAYAPIYSFRRKVFMSAVMIGVVTTLLAMVLAYYFVRPINSLVDGVRRFAGGQTDVELEARSRDECGELARAFNDMMSTVREQSELAQEKNRQYEELLRNILPDPIAKRLQEGEECIADNVSNVTVLLADLIGFEKISANQNADEMVTLLNDIVAAFDDAAEEEGVEKIKTIGTSYMAVSGLSIPRLDNSKRMVDFALEMVQIVRRVNLERETDLKLTIGIHAGPVVGGIVGRNKFIYDLWGDTVSTADRLRSENEPNTIRVSQSVHEQLHDAFEFDQQGRIRVNGDDEEEDVWTLRVA
ncbi:MAG: adenylate/guanylate cyclase domain-containing protein [Gammaproteobacteria bacterium]